jgi:alpha-mannosidase
MGDLLLFNPLPWDRDVSGAIAEAVVDRRGAAGDPTATRHFQDRSEHEPGSIAALHGHDGPLAPDVAYLPETTVPGYGWTTVGVERTADPSSWDVDDRTTVTTDHYELTFDLTLGGISEWTERDGREWIADDGRPFATPVHESLAEEAADRDAFYEPPAEERPVRWGGLDNPPRGWQPDWAAKRRPPDAVRSHRVFEAPDGYRVRQRLSAPMGDVVLQFDVPKAGRTITVEAAWEQGLRTDPEAVYLPFSFAIPDPTPRIDVGGPPFVPGEEQLPGSCQDHYTVQQWVDLSGPEGGVTVACPDAPLIQLGDYAFAANRRDWSLDEALLLGWVTNNYWETNFRARQPGAVRARYHLRPHDGFDVARAERTGLAATHAEPVVTAVEPAAAAPALPREGAFLDLPEPPIRVESIRPGGAAGVHDHLLGRQPAPDGSIVIRLTNVADAPRTARIGSGVVEIDAASRIPLLGGQGTPIDDVDPVRVSLDPAESVTIRLDPA